MILVSFLSSTREIISNIFMHNLSHFACCSLCFPSFHPSTSLGSLTFFGIDDVKLCGKWALRLVVVVVGYAKTNWPTPVASAPHIPSCFLSFIYSSCSVINDIMYVHTFTINEIYYATFSKEIVNKGKIILIWSEKENKLFAFRAHAHPTPRSRQMKNEIFIQPKQLIIK